VSGLGPRSMPTSLMVFTIPEVLPIPIPGLSTAGRDSNGDHFLPNASWSGRFKFAEMVAGPVFSAVSILRLRKHDSTLFGKSGGKCLTNAKRTFVARRQSQGQSVVYFGDCEREHALANLADVAVTVKNGDNRLTAGIPIAFLAPDLEKFGALHALCQRGNTEVTNGFISTALPNVFAMSPPSIFMRRRCSPSRRRLWAPLLLSARIRTPEGITPGI
jgi:hypothetical protein